MKNESGSRDFPIWLLSESNPASTRRLAGIALEARPPPILKVWSPVIRHIQESLFARMKKRIAEPNIYIFHAIKEPNYQPNSSNLNWTLLLENLVLDLRNLIREHKPVFLFSFGGFPFEFARRSMEETPLRQSHYWADGGIESEFKTRLDGFDASKTNIIPFLMPTVLQGKFQIRSHAFPAEADYLESAASSVADTILAHQDNLKIWE